jgi:hypothetical protein
MQSTKKLIFAKTCIDEPTNIKINYTALTTSVIKIIRLNKIKMFKCVNPFELDQGQIRTRTAKEISCIY